MTTISWRVVVGALALMSSACGSGDADLANRPSTVPSAGTDSDEPGGDDPVRVIPIGDSITAGPYYRPHLARMVAAAMCPIDFIGTFNGVGETPPSDAADLDLDHQAVGGATSGEISAQIDEWLQQQVPDVALVYLGTNDLYAEVERATTIDNLVTITQALREANPNVTVLLAQVMPADSIEQDVVALNAAIAALARRLDSTSSPVEAVDMAGGVLVDRDLVDGVHPDTVRSRVIAERWAKAIEPLLGDRCQL